MKISKEVVERWKKYARLYVMEHGYFLEDIRDTGQVWHIAHTLGFPREAYHIDRSINDNHIDTALRKVFPNMNKRSK